MATEVDWKGKEFVRDLRPKLAQNMLRAMLFAEQKTKESISVGQPVRRLRSGRLIGLEPSKPGEPPKVLFGQLRASIFGRVVIRRLRIIGQFGSTDAKASWLERGTSRMKARPFLRPILRRFGRNIADIITRDVN